MSILRSHNETFKKWQLRENPFRSTPPEDPQKLLKVFYGREEIIKSAMLALYECRNVFIRGAWGMGKTAIIKTLLYKLQQEVKEINEKMLVLYLGGFSGDSPNDFYRLLIPSLAKNLAAEAWDDKYAEIINAISGYVIQSSKTTIEGQVKLAIINLSIRKESPDNKSIPTSNINPYPLLMELLQEAEEKFEKVIIAVDDLDKKDTPIVKEILEGSLQLFRGSERRAFIMTGRAFTDLQEVTLQALGIFSEEVKLDLMRQEDLKQIAINYLNTAKSKPENKTDPFAEEVMNLITDYAQGSPRQLNAICEKLLRQAAAENRDIIDLNSFNSAWSQIKTKIALNLSPHLTKLLYIARLTGGITEDIGDNYLEQLGVTTFVQLIPLLIEAEKTDLITRQDTDIGFKFVASQLFDPKLLPESKYP